MPTLHPAVRIGHVHLKVADLDRALSFRDSGKNKCVKPRGDWVASQDGGKGAYQW